MLNGVNAEAIQTLQQTFVDFGFGEVASATALAATCRAYLTDYTMDSRSTTETTKMGKDKEV